MLDNSLWYQTWKNEYKINALQQPTPSSNNWFAHFHRISHTQKHDRSGNNTTGTWIQQILKVKRRNTAIKQHLISITLP